MQEQLCRNKILTQFNNKTGLLEVQCASSTLETKSKVSIFIKKKCLYLKSSSFSEPIPLFVILRSMGVESDRNLAQMVMPFIDKNS